MTKEFYDTLAAAAEKLILTTLMFVATFGFLLIALIVGAAAAIYAVAVGATELAIIAGGGTAALATASAVAKVVKMEKGPLRDFWLRLMSRVNDPVPRPSGT